MANSDVMRFEGRAVKRWLVPDYAAGAWLSIAILGQLAFSGYIAVFYGAPLLFGDVSAWNTNVMLNQPPFVEGASANTFSFGAHALGAGVIALMGGLQLVPFVRNRYRTFHRWNGRLFVTLVVLLSLSGYYLTWVRGPVPSTLSEYGTSVNGVLILSFAALAVRAIRSRRVAEHERWAIRLFLVSNAQWFLRIGGFGYFLIAQSLGVDVSFGGWFFQFWVWGCFIVPLLMAEVYFRTRASGLVSIRWTGAVLLAVCSVLTLVGSFVFSAFSLQLIQGTVSA